MKWLDQHRISDDYFKKVKKLLLGWAASSPRNSKQSTPWWCLEKLAVKIW